MAYVETIEAVDRKAFFDYLEREEFRKFVWDQLLKGQFEKLEATSVERHLWRRRRALEGATRGRRLRSGEERRALLAVGSKIECLRLSGRLEEARRARKKAAEEAVKVPRSPVEKRKELEASRLVAQLVGKKKAELDKYRRRE